MTDLDRIRSGDIKAAILDIESTGLKADWGFMICACLKEVKADSLNGKIHTFRSDNYKSQWTDEKLTKDLVEKMNEFDLIIHWYGSMFDIPFINSRALRHGLTPPARNFRRDLCFVSRGSLALTSNGLANVSRFMLGKTGKTRTDYDMWLGAMRGQKKATDYIVDHCEKDVIETEKLYKKFQPILGKLRRR